MKSVINNVLIAFLLLTLASAAAFAKTRKATAVFAADTKVNGKLVKRGTYDVAFDDQTSELSIYKGTKLVVKTATRLEKRDRKARGIEIQTMLEGMDQKLVSIAFGGSDQNIVVTQMGMQAGGN